MTSLALGIGVDRELLASWCDDVQVVSDLNTLYAGSAEKLFAE